MPIQDKNGFPDCGPNSRWFRGAPPSNAFVKGPIDFRSIGAFGATSPFYPDASYSVTDIGSDVGPLSLDVLAGSTITVQFFDGGNGATNLDISQTIYPQAIEASFRFCDANGNIIMNGGDPFHHYFVAPGLYTSGFHTFSLAGVTPPAGAVIIDGAGFEVTGHYGGSAGQPVDDYWIAQMNIAAGSGVSPLGRSADVPCPAPNVVWSAKTGPASGTPGQQVSYAATVTNNGNAPATNFSAAPTGGGLLGVSVSPAAPAVLAAGQSVTFTVTGTLPGSGTATCGLVADWAEGGPVATNQVSTAVVTSAANWSTSSKTVSKASLKVGETATFTIKVKNSGNAAGVAQVSDVVPAGLTNVTWSAPGFTPSSGTGSTVTATSGSIPPGGEATITITGEATSPVGVYTNSATVNGLEFSVPFTVQKLESDIAFTKEAAPGSPASVTPGGVFPQVITALNNGPDPATIIITDTLAPYEISRTWQQGVHTGSPTGGATSGTGDLVSGPITIPAGAAFRYLVNSTIDPNLPSSVVQFVNEATWAFADPSRAQDPTPSNDGPGQSSVGITRIGSFTVQKVADKESVEAGSTVVYTITVEYSGPAANSVQVSDIKPACVEAWTWTSVATGAASGNTSGSADIAETLSFTAAGSVVYTVVAQMKASAGNSVCSNRAKITPSTLPPGGTTPADAVLDIPIVVPPPGGGGVEVHVDQCWKNADRGQEFMIGYRVCNKTTSTATVPIVALMPLQVNGLKYEIQADDGVSSTAKTSSTYGEGAFSDTLVLPAGKCARYLIKYKVAPSVAYGTKIDVALQVGGKPYASSGQVHEDRICEPREGVNPTRLNELLLGLCNDEVKCLMEGTVHDFLQEGGSLAHLIADLVVRRGLPSTWEQAETGCCTMPKWAHGD